MKNSIPDEPITDAMVAEVQSRLPQLHAAMKNLKQGLNAMKVSKIAGVIGRAKPPSGDK